MKLKIITIISMFIIGISLPIYGQNDRIVNIVNRKIIKELSNIKGAKDKKNYYKIRVRGIIGNNDTTKMNGSISQEIVSGLEKKIRKKNNKIDINIYTGGFKTFTEEYHLIDIFFDFKNNKISIYERQGNSESSRLLQTIDEKNLSLIKRDFLKNAINDYREIIAKSKIVAKEKLRKEYKNIPKEILTKVNLRKINDTTFYYDKQQIKNNLENFIKDQLNENIDTSKAISALKNINAINRNINVYEEYFSDENFEDSINNILKRKKELLKTWAQNIKDKDTFKDKKSMSGYLSKYFAAELISIYIDSLNFSSNLKIDSAKFLTINKIMPAFLSQEDFNKLGFITNNKDYFKISQEIGYNENDSVFTFKTILNVGKNGNRIEKETKIKYNPNSDLTIYMNAYKGFSNDKNFWQKQIESFNISVSDANTIKEFYSLKEKISKNFPKDENLKMKLNNLEKKIKNSAKEIKGSSVADQILKKFFEEMLNPNNVSIADSITCTNGNKRVPNPLKTKLTEKGISNNPKAENKIIGTYRYDKKEQKAVITYTLIMKDGKKYDFGEEKSFNTNQNPWNPEFIPLETDFVKINIKTKTSLKNDNYGFEDEKEKKTLNPQNFEIATSEVSIYEYVEFLNNVKPTNIDNWIDIDKLPISKENGKFKVKRGGNLPITYVSYNGAMEYCRWKSKNDSKYNYTLPTEAQWEYVARNAKTQFSEDDYIGFLAQRKNKANFIENSQKPMPIKSKVSVLYNAYKIYDMFGNVWEWTSTREKGKQIIKGGAYDSDIDQIMPYSRAYQYPYAKMPNLGFRVIRTKK